MAIGNRRAVTLVETLVVIGLLGLLLLIMLPAVLGARETARKAQCQSNMRQLGLAIHAFETSYNSLPSSFCGVAELNGMRGVWCLSPAGQLLGQLGESTKADSIPSFPHPNINWSDASLDSPPLLRCPSDSLARERAHSYRFCRGVLPTWPDDPGGMFISIKPRRSRDALDGLAHTAFVSERITGTASNKTLRRDHIDIPANLGFARIAACIAANQSGTGTIQSTRTPLGSTWLTGNWAHTVYYHLLPPNSKWSDCWPMDNLGLAVVSARSFHPGGVHVLFGDGHCAFVGDLVDRTIWTAYATRAGAELIAF